MQALGHTMRATGSYRAVLKPMSRSFAASVAHGSMKKPKKRGQKTRKADFDGPDLTQDFRCPTGVGRIERMDYSDFMSKIQKLNPAVEFTKSEADMALERALSQAMPKAKLHVVQSALRGGTSVKKPQHEDCF
jgi:hypothetical protein